MKSKKQEKFAFGVRHIAYNAEMRKRRKELGLTQKQLAKMVGIGSCAISQVEGFKYRPPMSWGEKLASILGTTYEVLFPVWMEPFKLSRSSFDTEHIVTERLLPNMIKNLLPSCIDDTEEEIDRDFLRRNLKEILKTLSEREAKVIEMRFGLGNFKKSFGSQGGRTFEQIAKKFGVTKERIRQIEMKAIRKLKNPSRRRNLKEFL